jgi:hypothetical protein
VEDEKPAQGEDVLCSNLRTVKDEFARPEKERGTGKAALKRYKPAEKLIDDIDNRREYQGSSCRLRAVRQARKSH